MELNFSNNYYKKRAMNCKGYSNAKTDKNAGEAFLLLIKGVKKEDLSYLCKKMQEKLRKNNIILTEEECYKITQEQLKEVLILKDFSEYLLDLAYECIEVDGRHLGDNIIPNTSINTSSWISHSLYMAKAAENLAKKLGMNAIKAKTLGILHDYGRKFTHDFFHVIKGFEALCDEGWENEARATLTHSFINAGRCANCDPAENGFYINSEGKPSWEDGTKVDDITEVLENMQYDDYDMILNIADLIATDKGITSPYARVEDIAKRKVPDPKNRYYFLSEFTNKLIYVMKKGTNGRYNKENVNPLMKPEDVVSAFKKVSSDFQYFYEIKENLSMKSNDEIIEIKYEYNRARR